MSTSIAMPLLRFTTDQIEAAIGYSMAGGMALHLHRIIANEAKAPRCFVEAIRRGEHIAHLFGQDEDDLESFCRGLGVRVIAVERRGSPRMHIDLCSGPLRKAIARSVAYDAAVHQFAIDRDVV